jgi:hypothetical protein
MRIRLLASRRPFSGIAQFDSDCNPTGTCLTSAPSIFGQGETWKSYEETMPSNCFPELRRVRGPAQPGAVLHDCGQHIRAAVQPLLAARHGRAAAQAAEAGRGSQHPTMIHAFHL